MKKNLFIGVLMLLVMTNTVLAFDCEADKDRMKEVYGSNDTEFDLNDDGIVNLIDLGIFAQECTNSDEGVVEEVVKEKPVNKPVIKSSSVKTKYESDGSITFRTMGRTLQYPNNNMIVRWEPNTKGLYCWEYEGVSYCGTFFKGYGYNNVNVKVMG